MSLFEKYMIGGPYMHFISVAGLIALLVVIVKVVEIVNSKTYNTKKLDIILIAASLSLVLGVFSQIVGIVEALEAIKAAADISPQIVFQGAIVSFYSTIWGFIVFLIFFIIWAVLREIIKHKKN